MDLKLQPKPGVKIQQADQGIVSRKHYFVKKKFEEINQYFFPAHFIRRWIPKAQLLYSSVSDESTIQYECDFNRDVQNCFVEDYAEEVYLRTPPPCFVVFGKLGKRVAKLSEQIAKEFGSVLIQVDDIVKQVLSTQTETSVILDRLLRFGVSLTLNFILALLSYMAHTPLARHRGYVLCGLPSIPYLRDLSAEQQFNYLFMWDNKPTVFINVLFDDEDLIKERTLVRCEIENFRDRNCILYHSIEIENPEENKPSDEFDSLMHLFDRGTLASEPDIDVLPSRPWALHPRDEESQVWSELENYDIKVKPAVELISSRVDPQYFITVDSRIENEFEIVMARLQLLQIWKPPIAVPFFEPKTDDIVSEKKDLSKDESFKGYSDVGEEQSTIGEAEEDEYERKKVAEEPPQTAFLTLFAQKVLSPKFRWELSHYNYVCPVSLREGFIVEGKSEFAVIFMKYIYFLRDEKSMMKFIENPRAYVLPIRPKPICRFIIMGYPFSGKTSLARALANEFSISLLDFNTITKNDLDRKKKTYQEFCQHKAECREILRLNVQSWKDWRLEEEQRVKLIENWLLYIQTLLTQRIEQFYNVKAPDGEALESSSHESCKTMLMEPENSIVSGEEGEASLRIQGIRIKTEALSGRDEDTPSRKIVKAFKHKDYEFNSPSLEVEANLFFSSLWKIFSDNRKEKERRAGEELGECGESWCRSDESDEDIDLVNWCSLLPPQSLSSFLLKKKPCTPREKRQSFHVFLEAASKAYWTPCKLKTEFAKWRLPCYMDIPLCEIFLNNPTLLLKYVPEWLKERPPIPDPVDPMHPSVVEAGRKAYLRADVVTVKQSKAEIGALIRHAIEKAERDGMRVTGEVFSPGGWVLDNMTLDLDIWKTLACENIFGNHVYILVDKDAEHQRIINTWYDICVRPLEQLNYPYDYIEEKGEMGPESSSNSFDLLVDDESVLSTFKIKSDEFNEENFVKLLLSYSEMSAQSDFQVDEIFEKLLHTNEPNEPFTPPTSVDPFCHHIFKNSLKIWQTLKQEFTNEALIMVQTLSNPSTGNFFSRKLMILQNLPLGHQLQRFSSRVLNYFANQPEPDPEIIHRREKFKTAIEFFLFLLTIPKQLEDLKNWLISVGREESVVEIDITKKKPEVVFNDLLKDLMLPFLKRPRELEDFEVEEIRRSTKKQKKTLSESASELGEIETLGEEEEEAEDGEDLRIFGESGQLCIVNLERDIYALGKPEIALRYYGKLYYFYNEEAKNKFIEDPEKYAPYYSAIRCYPPLRVCVVGPIGCGKSALSMSVADQCSLTYVDYVKFLTKSLTPYAKPRSQKFNPLIDSKLLLSEDYNAQARFIRDQFFNTSYYLRQFWLENPIYAEAGEVRAGFKNKLIDLNKPILPKNYPPLTYDTIEALPEEKLYDDEFLSTLPQDPYVSMKDLEVILNAYLKNESDLTDYCIDKSLKTLWNTEPYISQGFVLDGFPLRMYDIDWMKQNNWFPDLVIQIMLPVNLVLERNINMLMEFWNIKLNQERAEQKSLEDTLRAVQQTHMLVRQYELYTEKREALLKTLGRKGTERSGINVNPDESAMTMASRSMSSKMSRVFKHLRQESVLPPDLETQLREEIAEILKQEFPPLIFNVKFETHEAGRARVTDYLVNLYKKDMAEIEKLKAELKELHIPWMEIDGAEDSRKNMISLSLRLDEIKKRISGKGEFAFPVKMELAEKLLEQGYYFLSQFGRWCPVQVYRMRNPIHMFRPLIGKGKVTPIVYRNYIYFVSGESETQKFIEDPIKYTFNENHHPNIPLRIAIIGPPKSGKSTIAKRFHQMFHLKVLTMGGALRFVMEKMPQSTLAKSIHNYLKRGCFLPLSVKMEALMASMNDPACVTQGYVFDGIPFDAALTQSLAERGKLPFVIVSLKAKSHFGKTNRENLDLQKFRLPYKNRVNLDSRYNDWNKTYKRFAQWNKNTYNNLFEFDANISSVDIFYQVYNIIRKSFFGILYYVEYCVSDRALPLQYLCVSQHEYELRKSPFHNNCPVCWAKNNRLSSMSEPPPHSGLVQYLNHFYWVCPTHMDLFLKNPKLYFEPHVPQWPTSFAKIYSKALFDSASPRPKVHGYGRCPVTRIDFPSSLDWEGSWEHSAIYLNHVYLFKNKERLDRFLAKPWRYCNADTKFEISRPGKSNIIEKLGPPKVTSLPPIGFLEQTVAEAIHDSLQIVGFTRPVYPDMSPAVTGCTFIGLYLKVHNKKIEAGELEKHFLDFMMQYCKAHRFHVSHYKRNDESLSDIGGVDVTKLDTESSEDDSPSKDSPATYDEPYNQGSPFSWYDLESQADKKMWTAKFLSPDFTQMKLTLSEELVPIPEIPRAQVILKYPTHPLRPTPVPHISHCLTFLYSARRSVQAREDFNYNTLYQPPPPFSSPYPQKMPFNPTKEFAQSIYSEESQSSFESQENAWQGKRVLSGSNFSKDTSETSSDSHLRLITELFIPRFHLFDKINNVSVPPPPRAIEEEPIIYYPQRDYAYMLLFSEFFHMTHTLKCYEWSEAKQQLEYSNLLDKNLGHTGTDVDYFFLPSISSSVKTMKSLQNYQKIFEAATEFAVQPQMTDREFESAQKIRHARDRRSLINFIEGLLMERLNEIFLKVSASALSYDSFEIEFSISGSTMNEKPSISIREVLPYPPLSWDILSRPYYALSSIPSIFQTPALDHIAHERHVSVLDGLAETNDQFRFVRYPTWIADSAFLHHNRSKAHFHGKKPELGPFYFVYDFFNLDWTAFLTQPIPLSYRTDMKSFHCEFNDLTDSHVYSQSTIGSRESQSFVFY